MCRDGRAHEPGRARAVCMKKLRTIGLILGVMLSAWLRYDVESLAMSWTVAVILLAGMIATWIVQSQRVPDLKPHPEAGGVGSRDEPTVGDEKDFAEALRSWHARQQREAWRETVRAGPARLIRSRALFFFLWLSFLAIALVPPFVIPRGFMPQLPRFAVVLRFLAVLALTAAAEAVAPRDQLTLFLVAKRKARLPG